MTQYRVPGVGYGNNNMYIQAWDPRKGNLTIRQTDIECEKMDYNRWRKDERERQPPFNGTRADPAFYVSLLSEFNRLPLPRVPDNVRLNQGPSASSSYYYN